MTSPDSKPPRSIGRPSSAVAPYTAVVTACLAVLGTALLLTAASHVHVDRSTGRPEVTWRGPLAAYADELAWCGWLSSAAAMALCVYANNVYRSRWDLLAWAAFFVANLSFAMSCAFWAAGED